MLTRTLTIALYSIISIFSSSSLAIVVTESRPINCSTELQYSGTVTNYHGASLRLGLPTASMIQPWSTMKQNSVSNVVSLYGSFFRINSVNIPGDLPFKFYLLSNNSSNQMFTGQIAQSAIQWWSQPPGSSSPSIQFNESNGVTLAFRQIPGNYNAGMLYSGSINMSIFSGTFYAPNSNFYPFTDAINALMSSGAPTTCNIPVTIRIRNSCDIYANPINFGNVTTADVQNGKVTASSTISASCLLNDSVSLSLSGGSIDSEGNVFINTGNNLQTKLTLADNSGNVITNSTPLKIQGGIAMNYKLNASLGVVDKEKPIPLSDVSGNAVLTLSFN